LNFDGQSDSTESLTNIPFLRFFKEFQKVLFRSGSHNAADIIKQIHKSPRSHSLWGAAVWSQLHWQAEAQ
jgi:hypothetical protein